MNRLMISWIVLFCVCALGVIVLIIRRRKALSGIPQPITVKTAVLIRRNAFSPTQLFYFFVFVYFAFMLIKGLFFGTDAVWQATLVKPDSRGDFQIFKGIFFVLWLFVFLQILRTYICLHMCETPSSSMYRRFIMPLTRHRFAGWAIRGEYILRCILIAFISMKAVAAYIESRGVLPTLTNTQIHIVFFMMTYGALFFWDILVVSFNRTVKWKETWIWLTFPGVFLWALVFIHLPDVANGSSPPSAGGSFLGLTLPVVGLAVLIIVSFFYQAKRDFKMYAEFVRHLSALFIPGPYYGETAVPVMNKVFHKESPSGTANCGQTNCQFTQLDGELFRLDP